MGTAMATNETNSTGSTLQGAMVTMMAIGLVVQLAILGLLIWLVAGGAATGSPKDVPPTADQSKTETHGRVMDSEARDGRTEPTSKPNEITLVRNLPPMIPDSDRDLTWYSAGDELFALEATVIANYGGIPPAATFRVPGRGSVETMEGSALYPGSRVQVLKISSNLVVVSNGTSERDLAVPRNPLGGFAPSEVKAAQPAATNPGGNIPDTPDGASMIRPTDPRLEALLRAKGLLPDSVTTDAAAPTAQPQPRIEGSAVTGTRSIAEAYPAGDWEGFIRELRQSLIKTVLMLDTFDNAYRPSGIEVANIFESDAILFDFLRLEAGDVIVGVSGTPVRSKRELDAAMRDQKFESEVRMQVNRAGEVIDLVVKKFPQ